MNEELRNRAIRSFVVRAGRMTVGQSRALEDMWPRYGVEYSPQPLDLDALFASASTALRVPLFLALFLLVRGVPALLLYRDALPSRDRFALAFYSATALPLVVAVTAIGVETDRMTSANAAALVGAAMASVLVYPLIARGIRKRSAAVPAPSPAS